MAMCECGNPRPKSARACDRCAELEAAMYGISANRPTGEAAVKAVVAALRERGPMKTVEVRDLFGFRRQHAMKVLVRARDAGLIEVAEHGNGYGRSNTWRAL